MKMWPERSRWLAQSIPSLPMSQILEEIFCQMSVFNGVWLSERLVYRKPGDPFRLGGHSRDSLERAEQISCLYNVSPG